MHIIETIMKHTHLFIIACLALTAATCGGEKTLVKESAYGYLDAMGNYRFSDARPYCTPETQQATIDYIEQKIMPFVDPKSIEDNMPARITIQRVRMVNDTTAMAYYRKVTPIKVQNDSIDLVKRNGEWKVNLIIKPNRKLEGLKKLGGKSAQKERN